MYLNHINLCDQQQDVYASLPYRVYFKYKEVGIRSNGIAFEVVDWKEIRQAAGESGKSYYACYDNSNGWHFYGGLIRIFPEIIGK